MGRFRNALAAPGLAAIAEVKRRSPSAGDLRPDADPAGLIASSWPDACRLIEQYTAAGISKFVVRPASPAQDPGEFLRHFVRDLMPMQT